MNNAPLPPSTTDEPPPRESIREDRFAEAALALQRARSDRDNRELQSILKRYPDLTEELRELLELESYFGLDRPWADPLGLIQGAPLSLKYDVLEEANHGAFGRVLKARDRILGRFVAIKVFKPDLAHKSALARFIEEPQIAGQLDHPGVVPVHELGKTPDGRPYIVMKWVEGPTLHDLLRARRSPDDVPRLVEIFKQVCRTVGCAHRKWGVLHRDLKPANLMIGADGEVLVMDWGLSKVLLGSDDERGEEAPGRIETVRTLDPALATVAGTRLGTVAYMAPEQADENRNAEVTARSDVFALGAILCEILTGRSPYWTPKLLKLEASSPDTDPDRREREIGLAKADLLERVKNARLEEAFARLDSCGADAALIRLAKDCLAAAPEKRPVDAGAAADAVAAYQNGLQAEKVALQVQGAALRSRLNAARWRLTAAAAVGLFFAGALVVGFWYYSVEEQKRQEASAVAVRNAVRDEDARSRLGEVDKALRDAKWEKAREELRGAEGRLAEGGPPELRVQAGAARRELAFIDEWEKQRKQRSHIVDGVDFDDGSVALGYGKAFHDLGIDLHSASAAREIRESPIRDQLLAALDHWVMVEKYPGNVLKLLKVAQDASVSDWGRAFRKPEFPRDPAALARLAAETPVEDYSPVEIESMAWALLRTGGDAEPLLRGGLILHGDDFWLNLLMALTLERKVPGASEEGRRRLLQEEAVEHLRVALAFQPHSAFARTLLGGLLTDCGRSDEAVTELKRSLQDQDLTVTRYALARALLARGAKDDFRQADNLCNETPLPQFQELQKQIRERGTRP